MQGFRRVAGQMSVEIELRRVDFGDSRTFGELYGPDGSFLCHTLEDAVRKLKIYGETAIPSGRYELAITHSPKYGRLMPRLIDVPFFRGVLIHPGNTEKDSEGCILVGDDDPRTKNFLDSSRKAFERIFPILRKLVDKYEVFVNVNGGYAAEMWEVKS
jgi:hypothetical protein